MLFILAGFALLALVELPPLLMKGQKRALFAFLVIFFLALALTLLQSAGIVVPSVLLLCEKLFLTIGLHY